MTTGISQAVHRNVISRLDEFMSRWDRGLDRRRPSRVLFNVSYAGQINEDGNDVCHSAQLLTSSHPRFLDCLEIGVRELVSLLAYNMGLITYSSCEGHPESDNAPLRIREVGVVPRNGSEYLWALRALADSARLANAMHRDSAVAVRVSGTLITTRTLPRGAIDVLFESSDTERYFADLEPVYKTLLSALRQSVTPM
jgi:hypothetical protein